MFPPSDLVAANADLLGPRAALRALPRLTRADGADEPPEQVTLTSWSFAHGLASLVAGGSLPAGEEGELVDGFAGLVHP